MTAEGGHSGAVKGAACLLLSTFFFGIAAALVKKLSSDYSAFQITFFRNLFGLVPALWMSGRLGMAGFSAVKPAAHIWRSIFGVGSMLLIFAAYSLISLSDATAISFAAPLFITALSVPMLAEKVGRHRWTAVLAGFAGVLFVMKPGSGVFHYGSLLALAAALLHALAMISLRKLRITENAQVTTLYFTIIATVLTGALLPLGWKNPELQGAALLAALGLISGVGQFFLTLGYGFAEASLISPFTYTSMIWATLFGGMFWGERLTFSTLIGTFIVVSSGIYILHRERIRQK